MPSVPTAVEICPKCKANFTAAPYEKPGRSSKFKTCPKGHESSVYQLHKTRATFPPPEPPKPGDLVVVAISAAGDREDFKSMTAALVNSYEQLIATTPPASHGVVNGVFANNIKLAKQLLGVA